METLIFGVILFSPLWIFALAALFEPARPKTPETPPGEDSLNWEEWWTGR